MDITPQLTAQAQQIGGYGDGGFTIAGQRHEGSVLVVPEQTMVWGVAALEDLTEASLLPVIERAEEVEILLLGTGAQMQMVPVAIRSVLREHGIIVDAMDTGAACRTYNILLQEGRRVMAALIAV